MSATVISQGYIAILQNPIADEDQREELSENLYDSETGLELNYEGTLIILDEYALKSYSEREFYSDLFIVGGLNQDKARDFVQLASANGFEVLESTVQPYVCVWYNGSDSPVSMMTKEEFLNKE